VRLEGPYDLEGLGEDANVAIVATDEEIVRSGAKAAQIITLTTSALTQTVLIEILTDIEDRRALPVVWQTDFGNVEKVEDFPLKMARQR